MFSYKHLKVLRLLLCAFEIGATLVSSCLRHSAHTPASLHFAPQRDSDGVISSKRRRPLLLCLAAGLAKHTATNAVQTNQVDMRTEEMRTLCIRLICIVQCGQRHEARWRLQI